MLTGQLTQAEPGENVVDAFYNDMGMSGVPAGWACLDEGLSSFSLSNFRLYGESL